MPGETIPLHPNDEAPVFSTGSILMADNGFTGYWHGGDLGAHTEPTLGADSDFIQINVLPNSHNIFTVLSDLLLITGWPYSPTGSPVDFAMPEVQILAVSIWQEVRFSDGSLGFVEVAEGEEIPDHIFGAYENGGLANTSLRVEFDAAAPGHVNFPDTDIVWRIENGEVVIVDIDVMYGGYDITGNYFVEVVTIETNPIFASTMAGADIHPNGRYVLMEGDDGVETLANGFRTEAWGDGWLQRIPFGGSTPVPTDGVHIRHTLTTDDQSSLLAVGDFGDPAGEDACVVVETPAGAPTVSGIIDVDATAIGGGGTVQGGSARVLFDAVAYSGRDIVLVGRAQGGDAPSPGTASAEISDGLFSMGLAYPDSVLRLELSAIGGSGSGGTRGASSLVFHNNSISGWGGIDIVTVTLGRSGEDSAVAITDNSFILGANNDRLTIIVNGTGALTLTSTNQFQGGDGFDILTLDVEGGISFSLGPSASAFVTGIEVLRGGRGNDTLTGDSEKNYLQGEGGNDVVAGGFGDDILDGGLGNDTLDGGISGNDTVTFEQLELAADGVTVSSRATQGVTANLGTGVATGAGSDGLANFENVRGTGFDDVLTGDNGGNVLNGLDGNDTLNGGWGDDWLIGGRGNDTMIGGNGWDTADYSAQFPDHLFTPTYNTAGGVQIDLRVNGAQDTGSGGIDQLSGIENLVGTSANDTLVGDDFANHFVGGAGNDNLYGNGSADTLIGNSGNDVLNGGTGADTMAGGSGNDQYYTDTPGDSIIETANEGDDIAFVLGTYTLALGVSVETLVALNQASTDPLVLTGNEFGQSLYGNAGDNYLNGGAGADYLVGLAGNDSLLGGSGADHLQGGTGNDVYYVDAAGDLVTELNGEGEDILVATASYTLGTGVSIETLSAEQTSAAINLTGNELAQSLYGNAGNNILTGMGGADYMVGGAGNDRYYVDTSDYIAEGVGGGDDWIFVSTSYALRDGNEIETLVAVNQDSLAQVDFSGNEFGQSLYGSQGVNNLNGGGGNDYLVGLGGNDFLFGDAGNDNLAGGTGNDLYYVDSGDQIFEAAGEGDDLAVALQSFALGAGQSVETLSAAEGAGAIDLTGNALAQSLYGNGAANVLTTGGGADYLVGGAGNDVFVLTNAAGIATVADYAAGDVVDLRQYLSLANGTDPVAGGYVKIVGTQLMVDATGGADSWTTIANVGGSGAVTIRYASGGNPADVSVSRSAGQEAAVVSKVALETDAPAHAQLLDDWHAFATDAPPSDTGFDPITPHLAVHGII